MGLEILHSFFLHFFENFIDLFFEHQLVQIERIFESQFVDFVVNKERDFFFVELGEFYVSTIDITFIQKFSN